MRASPEEQRRRRPSMLSFYSRLIRNNDLVLDVGANHGDRSQLFLDLGARVVAVEPQPHCAEILRRRFRSDPRIEVLEAALDTRPGTGHIRLSNNDLVASMSPEWIERASSSGRFKDSWWKEEVKIKTTTLDDVISRYGAPAFTKIDVEGMEHHVLKGLSSPLPALSFEYTPEHIRPALECLDLLADLGTYQFNLSAGESMKLWAEHHVKKEELAARLRELEARRGQEESGDVYAVLECDPPSQGPTGPRKRPNGH